MIYEIFIVVQRNKEYDDSNMLSYASADHQKTSLPNVHNLSYEDTNPYKHKLTNPSLLNQNISF